MDDVQKQVVERLKQANNILVTVKTDPSIDLLAACLGLSLVLDKIGKHATAVFSGQVPSAMEFLKPEETLEETPNSLRDFIISLDKSKADKLRYKVEDKVVRIFITPFKAGLSEADLEFSQGDFNIDLLVALGVHEQAELDAAVTAHGRILHDAGVISINTTPNGNLGTLNWQGTSVSSVSEMVASLAKELDPTVFDEQIATALLTGIVAETARFSNDKTSPATMSVAGELMAAGANQQLVATELQASIAVGAPGSVKADIKPSDDGTLEIEHAEMPEPAAEVAAETAPEAAPLPVPAPEPEAKTEEAPLPASKPAVPESAIQHGRTILPMPDPGKAGDSNVSDVASSSFTGASFGDEDHANTGQAYLIDNASEVKGGASGSTSAQPPTTDLPPVAPAIMPPADDQLLPPLSAPAPEPTVAATPTATPPAVDEPKDQTLEDIEASVKGMPAPTPDAASPAPPVPEVPGPNHVENARQQVIDALSQGPQPLKPLASLGASAPTVVEHDEKEASAKPEPSTAPAQPAAIEVDDEGNLKTLDLNPTKADPNALRPSTIPLPSVVQSPAPGGNQASSGLAAPPPMPPPIMPGSYTPVA